MVVRFRCAALLFDLDGVLVHSAASVQRSWRMWARDNGIPYAAVERAAHGRRTRDTVRELAPHLDAASVARELEDAQALDLAGVVAGRGADALVRGLDAARWAVVTSGSRRLARARLSAAGLPEPQVLVCGDDVTRGKPEPDGYLSAAERLGRAPSACVVVEDAPAGVQAARRAGMRVIGLVHGCADTSIGEVEVHADWCGDISVEHPGAEAGDLRLAVTRSRP